MLQSFRKRWNLAHILVHISVGFSVLLWFSMCGVWGFEQKCMGCGGICACLS